MPRKRTKGEIKAVCCTQDYRLDEIHLLDVWFQHFISVERPCAIVKKMYRRKPAYSVWRTIDPAEQEHFQELKTGQLPTEFELIRDWKLKDEYLEGVRRVTTDDVQRVAKKYLVEDNRTVGTLVPVKKQK